jgi:hypothetical protein
MAGVRAVELPSNPGFEVTPAVATRIARDDRLYVPFSAVLFATPLVGSSPADIAPIAVLAAAVGWLVTVALPNREDRAQDQLAADPAQGS